MDTQPDPSGDKAEAEAPSGRGPAEKPPTELHDARVSRVLDYQYAALEEDDPLTAGLASLNSGLMRIAIELDEPIAKALESDPQKVAMDCSVQAALDTLLRVTRQVDRLAQTEVRVAKARQSQADNRGGASHGGKAPGKTVVRSEDTQA